jgi:hypothetical protein
VKYLNGTLFRLCNIWIVQYLYHSKFGSFKIWIQQYSQQAHTPPQADSAGGGASER